MGELDQGIPYVQPWIEASMQVAKETLSSLKWIDQSSLGILYQFKVTNTKLGGSWSHLVVGS